MAVAPDFKSLKPMRCPGPLLLHMCTSQAIYPTPLLDSISTRCGHCEMLDRLPCRIHSNFRMPQPHIQTISRLAVYTELSLSGLLLSMGVWSSLCELPASVGMVSMSIEYGFLARVALRILVGSWYRPALARSSPEANAFLIPAQADSSCTTGRSSGRLQLITPSKGSSIVRRATVT